MLVVGRPVEVAAEYAPPDPIAAGSVHLRKARIAEADRILHERRHRYEFGVVIDHLIVDFVSHHNETTPLCQRHDCLEGFTIIDRATRVVRVDDDDRARSIRD